MNSLTSFVAFIIGVLQAILGFAPSTAPKPVQSAPVQVEQRPTLDTSTCVIGQKHYPAGTRASYTLGGSAVANPIKGEVICMQSRWFDKETQTFVDSLEPGDTIEVIAPSAMPAGPEDIGTTTPPALQTYSNTHFGFSFQYPVDSLLSKPGDFDDLKGYRVARIDYIKRAPYTVTGTLGFWTDEDASSTCITGYHGEGTFVKSKWNGITIGKYSKDTDGIAYYDRDRSTWIPYKGLCFVIETDQVTSKLANPTYHLSPEEQDVADTLAGIAATFKFIATSSPSAAP
jgi:hypothetical protein